MAKGDPIDVDSTAGQGSLRCIAATAPLYPSNVSCFEPSEAAKSGTWMMVIPLVATAPPVVVGLLPTGATTAVAFIGKTTFAGVTRGRWFLIRLKPGSLGKNNRAKVTVQYEESLSGPPCWKALINDWYDGRIDRAYPVSCYRQALRMLPAGLPQTPMLFADLHQALAHAHNGIVPAGQRGRATTTVGSNGSIRLG